MGDDAGKRYGESEQGSAKAACRSSIASGDEIKLFVATVLIVNTLLAKFRVIDPIVL